MHTSKHLTLVTLVVFISLALTTASALFDSRSDLISEIDRAF